MSGLTTAQKSSEEHFARNNRYHRWCRVDRKQPNQKGAGRRERNPRGAGVEGE